MLLKSNGKRENSVYLYGKPSFSLSLNVVSWYVWTAQRALPAAILRYFCVSVKLLFLLTIGMIVRYWNVCFKFCFQCKFEEVWATISSFRPYREKKDQSKPGLQSAIAVGASLTVFLCSVTEKIEMKTIIKRNGEERNSHSLLRLRGEIFRFRGSFQDSCTVKTK